ncbi:hypothetical protein [Candidatus Nitrososphaera evergladensis]|uniref:hypothetical protein n=1 Tax=Candidatus Nitrososphaera evergladensis TaxID=1459637 RepID=UPI0011E588B0|nr:hypothetical protein [Candidatus Nitrososphaera evergladensis]
MRKKTLTALIVGLAILSSLSVTVIMADSATAQKDQAVNQTSTASGNATAAASEAVRNATTSAQNAGEAARNATASAGNAIANATKAGAGMIGAAITNATSSLNKTISNPSSITVTPDSVNPGDIVVVKGAGFSANQTITLTFDNSSNATTAKADKSGAFNATMTTPNDAKNGTHNITATDREGKSATATITIAAAPKANSSSSALSSFRPSS